MFEKLYNCHLLALITQFKAGIRNMAVLALVACLNISCAQVKPTNLTESDFSIIDRTIVAILNEFHYEKLKLDSKMSDRIFDHYVKILDPQKIYFLQSDIAKFSEQKSSFKDKILLGDLGDAFQMNKVLQIRVAEQNQKIISLLDKEYDFSGDQTITIDRENSEYALTMPELETIWEDRLKYELMNIMLNGQSQQEAKKTLKRRYEVRAKRLGQIKFEDIFQTYISAVMESFDPHSSYFSPKASESFNIAMSLKLNGIGTVLRQDEDTVKIVEIIKGGPADLSGKFNISDEIIAIAQGEEQEWLDIHGMRLDDVVEKIRGEKGTVIRLQLSSAKNKGKIKEVTLVRDIINLDKQAAQSQLKTITIPENNSSLKREVNVGVITLPTFYSDIEGKKKGKQDARSTTADIQKLITELINKNKIDGLVIDLRANGGGSLEEAINLSGLFVDGKTVVQIKSIDGNIKEERSQQKKAFYKGPMVVLTDRLSASASEIFAGAMQDYGRAVIVGSNTYGKGTVQTVIPLNQFMRFTKEPQNFGQIKFTISKFYRPSGSSTQLKGVQPDLNIPSFFPNTVIGESAQKYALPWDEIKPAKDFKPDSKLGTLIPQLISLHHQRLETDPALIIYQKQANISLTAWKQKTFSLNFEKRKQEKDRREKENFEFGNQLRKLSNLPELTFEKFKENNDFMSEEEKKNMADPILDEGLRVLGDLIQLSEK